MARWPAVLVWAVTRGLTLWLLVDRERSVTGDVQYYRSSLDALAETGVGQTLVEYPVPGLGLLALPWALLELLGRPGLYAPTVATLALLTDAAFLGLLMHTRRWGRHDHTLAGITTAEWVWLLAVPALGATVYARFDLVPGILVGVAVLYAAHRPAVAAGIAAVATSLKYWPAIMLPSLAALRASRRRVAATVAAVGGVLALASLVSGGWERLFTPFTWQGDRGLQIESVAATPAMIGWALGPGPYSSAYTQHNAWEIFGPGVGLLLWLTRMATIALVVVLGLLWWRAWRSLADPSQGRAVDAVVWLCLAAVAGFIVTSKVFSPQYLLWLLPAAAAGLVAVRDEACWRRLRSWACLLVVATALTQPFFPLWYGPLLDHRESSLQMVALLAVRNALVLWLFLSAVREAWRALSTSAPSPGWSASTSAANRPGTSAPARR